MDASTTSDALLDERGLSKLRWRCRRGLLENDLFIEKFFARHASGLTVRQAEALGVLMDLSDNDLLDLGVAAAAVAGRFLTLLLRSGDGRGSMHSTAAVQQQTCGWCWSSSSRSGRRCSCA